MSKLNNFEQIRDAYNSNKLHKMLGLAINDLKTITKRSDYEVDLDSWHVSREIDVDTDDTMCYVCVAGSVLANHGMPKSLGYVNNIGFIEEVLGLNSNDAKILADFMDLIDELRQGDVDNASSYLKEPREDINYFEYDISIDQYNYIHITMDEYLEGLENLHTNLLEANI